MNVAIVDIDAIFILKRCVCSFPSRNTSAAASQLDITALYPCSAEAIEEVRLTSDGTVGEVRTSYLPNIYLQSSAFNCSDALSKMANAWIELPNSPCLDS